MMILCRHTSLPFPSCPRLWSREWKVATQLCRDMRHQVGSSAHRNSRSQLAWISALGAFSFVRCSMLGNGPGGEGEGASSCCSSLELPFASLSLYPLTHRITLTASSAPPPAQLTLSAIPRQPQPPNGTLGSHLSRTSRLRVPPALRCDEHRAIPLPYLPICLSRLSITSPTPTPLATRLSGRLDSLSSPLSIPLLLLPQNIRNFAPSSRPQSQLHCWLFGRANGRREPWRRISIDGKAAPSSSRRILPVSMPKATSVSTHPPL